MKIVWRQLYWEHIDLLRRLRGHPVTVAAIAIGFPTILLAYGLFGFWIADRILEVGSDDPEYFAQTVNEGARVFALVLVAMASSIVLGNLFNQRPRVLLGRYRTLPMQDWQVYLARKVSEDGTFVVLVLLPMFSVVSLRLWSGGVPGGLALILFAMPFLLSTISLVSIRVVLLWSIFLFPDRLLSWRAALWLLIFAVAFCVRPATVFFRTLWTRSESLNFWPTDWTGSVTEAWLSGQQGRALLIFGAVAAASLCLWWLDFAAFRALMLRRYDRLLAKLHGTGLTGGRMDVLGRALDRIPVLFRARPLRGFVKKDILRVARDPILVLSIQVPVLILAISAAAVEISLTPLDELGAVPPELGTTTRAVTFAALGAMLVVSALTHSVLLVSWEGPRLGPLRQLPLSEASLYAGKARAATFLLAIPWLLVYYVAWIATGPWEPFSLVGSLFVIPMLLLGSAFLAARIGTTVGAVFARPENKNPLLGVGMVGLGLQFGLIFLVLASLALSALPPALFGAKFLFVMPCLVALWVLSLPLLQREGQRAIRKQRVE